MFALGRYIDQPHHMVRELSNDSTNLSLNGGAGVWIEHGARIR